MIQSHENAGSRLFIFLGFPLEGGTEFSLLAMFNIHVTDIYQKRTKQVPGLTHQRLPLCVYANTRQCSQLTRASCLLSSCFFF